MGPGVFFTTRQNTVYLLCESAGFHRVWHKPGRSYQPHMTLYDGSSRQYAQRLLELLDEFDIRFEFSPTPLFELHTKTPQVALPLELHVQSASVTRALKGVGIENVRILSEADRLEYVSQFLEFLFIRRNGSALSEEAAQSKPVLAFGKVRWARFG